MKSQLLSLSIFLALSGFVLPLLELQILFFCFSAILFFFSQKEQPPTENPQLTQLLQRLETKTNEELFAKSVDDIMEQHGDSRLQMLESLEGLRQIMMDFERNQNNVTHLLLGHLQHFHETAAEQWEETLSLQKEFNQILNETMNKVTSPTWEQPKKSSTSDESQEQLLKKTLKPFEVQQENSNRYLSKVVEEILGLQKILIEASHNSVYGSTPMAPSSVPPMNDTSQTVIAKQMKVYMGKIEKISTYMENSLEGSHGTELAIARQTEAMEKVFTPLEVHLHGIKKMQEQQISVFQKQENILNNLSASLQLLITAVAEQTEIFISMEGTLEDQKSNSEMLILSTNEQTNHLSQNAQTLKQHCQQLQGQFLLLQQNQPLITTTNSATTTLNSPEKELDTTLRHFFSELETMNLDESQQELAENSLQNITSSMKAQFSQLIEQIKV